MKKILITSGGGAKGAFTVGALQVLQGAVPAFDFISGTSTGSLIAAMVAARRLDVLIDVYSNTTDENVLTPQNIIRNLRDGKPFLFDTRPLVRQILERLTDAMYNDIMNAPVVLCLNAVCLQTAKLSVFTTKSIQPGNGDYDVISINSAPLMRDALLGSSSQAVFLPPVTITTTMGGETRTRQYTDGGNREVIPTRVVIDNMSGSQPYDIYILSNAPHAPSPPVEEIFRDLTKVLVRAMIMFLGEVGDNDIDALVRFKTTFPSPVRIFYIHPDRDLDPEFPTGLRFDTRRMRAWMRDGKAKAEKVLRDFPNGNLPLVV